MPINGTTGAVRTPKHFDLRSGYKRKGSNGNYPKDTDVIVVRKTEDAVPQEVIDAYGGQRIADAAEADVWSLGKAVRLMLPWEFDFVSPEGREVALDMHQRLYGASKLRCIGTGGDREHPGEARCFDHELAKKIANKVGGQVVTAESAWTITCVGADCPFHKRQRVGDREADRGKDCMSTLQLQAMLLHPTTDRKSADYCRRLGWVRITTGSWNAMQDIQSGLMMLRAEIGQTQRIPFTLRRVPHRIQTPEGRQVKSTYIVEHDPDEAVMFRAHPQLSLVRPGLAGELIELARAERELLALAAPEPSYRSFQDLDQPDDRPRLGLPSGRQAGQPSPPATNDRDDVVAAALTRAGEQREDESIRAAAEPPETEALSDAQLRRQLTPDEREELKLHCGVLPPGSEAQVREASLRPFRDLVQRALRETVPGWVDMPPSQRPGMGDLTVRQAQLIRGYVREARAAADQDDRPVAVDGDVL